MTIDSSLAMPDRSAAASPWIRVLRSKGIQLPFPAIQVDSD
jgi:hypothetical protein